MTGPRVDATFNRAAAKKAGYSDAEIDAFLASQAPADPYKPTTPRAASESTLATRDKAPARDDAAYVGGLARQTGQGATFGFADELEAGARTGLGLTGDYRKTRDDIRAKNSAFAEENPLASLTANVVGGVATGRGLVSAGRAVPALARMGAASGMIPRIEATATTAQKLGGAMRAGAAAGAAGGAGMAKELDDVPMGIVAGGVAGGALGGLFSAGTDAIRGARNVVSAIGQGDRAAGVVRRAIRAEAPEVAGTRRVLSTLGRAGQSVDDLAAASRAAPEEAALAELVPNNQGVRGLRIARNVGRERDAIDQSLSERAGDEASRWSQSVSRHSGVAAPRDAQAFAGEALDGVRNEVDDLYRAARQQPDADATEILGVVEDLNRLGRGRQALTRAGELSTGHRTLQDIDPRNPQVSVANLQHLRQGLDHAIEGAVREEDHQMVRILTDRRATVDRVLKEAGGQAQQDADALWANANARGASFRMGQRVESADSPEKIMGLAMGAEHPQAFQQGSASKLLSRVAGVADGEGGQIRNPVQGSVGSPIRRARTATAFPSQDAYTAARGDAEQIVGRLRTRQAVSSNSTTAANLSEMADEFMSDPAALLQAPVNPIGALRSLGERGARAAVQGLNAQQATQMGRLLGAGLPGQMTREEAVAMLERMAPSLRAQLMRQLATRGAISGAAARGVTGPSR